MVCKDLTPRGCQRSRSPATLTVCRHIVQVTDLASRLKFPICGESGNCAFSVRRPGSLIVGSFVRFAASC